MAKQDPYGAFRFRMEIDGLTVAQFSEISGLQAETETEPYEEGGVNDFVHELPKRTKFPHLTLKRGITDRDDLWQWYHDVVSGTVKRRNGSVVLLDSAGEEKWRWTFDQAYPVKWTGPDLRADNNAVAFEAVELVHKGLKKA